MNGFSTEFLLLNIIKVRSFVTDFGANNFSTGPSYLSFAQVIEHNPTEAEMDSFISTALHGTSKRTCRTVYGITGS